MIDFQDNDSGLERAVIGSLLLDPRHAAYVQDRGVTPDSFVNPLAKKAYERMIVQFRETGSFDILSLSTDSGALQAYLVDATAETVSSANLETWVKQLRNIEARRLISTACKEAELKIGKNETSILETLDSLNLSVLRSADIVAERRTQTLSDLAKEAFDNIARSDSESIPWFEPGTEGRNAVRHFKRQLFILAGESGTGKTEMSLSCAVKPSVESGKHVLYVCTESPASEIFGRLAGCICGIPYNYLTAQNCIPDFVNCWGETMNSIRRRYAKNLFIVGSESRVNTVSSIRALVRKNIMQHGMIDLLVVDFLQDVRSDNPKDDEYTRIGKTVNGIKDIVDEFNIAGLLNTQLNRTDSKMSERPTLYRLKGSGEIEQKAHVVAFVYRDRKANKNIFYSAKTRGVKPFELELDFTKYGYRSREHSFPEEDCP